MFNKRDPKREQCMLTGKFRNQGYDWWWHSLTAKNAETGEERPFFLEFFVCNPALAEDIPTLGQHPDNKKEGKRPSYLMVKAGTWLPGGGQFHRFFPWKDVRLNMGVPFSVEADDCFCDGNNIRGRISISEDEAEAHPEWMCDAGTIEFDLKIEKKIAFNVGYGAGGLFRKLKAFERSTHQKIFSHKISKKSASLSPSKRLNATSFSDPSSAPIPHSPTSAATVCQAIFPSGEIPAVSSKNPPRTITPPPIMSPAKSFL